MRRRMGLVLAPLLALAAACGSAARPTPPASAPTRGPWPDPPRLALDPRRHYQALVHTTAGSFVIDLFARQNPAAVASFIFLARHHFYDGLTFFRVLPNYLVQTGSPTNNGLGGPGYTLPAALPPPFPYQAGMVALARMPDGRASGSQFFICLPGSVEALNHTPRYPELGRVVQGMQVVARIAGGPLRANPVLGNEKSLPLHPVRILSIAIISGAGKPS